MASQTGVVPTVSMLPKACENCRIRKIKCNRELPCSNCATSNISCRPAPSAREHRPRILVSNNYEKQIELINERLSGIERSLKNLSIHPNKRSPSVYDDQQSEPDDSSSTAAQYEGDSSFQQQSIRASELAENLAGRQPGELTEAIESLKTLVHTSNSQLMSDPKLYFSEARAKLPELELLPPAFVIAILKKVKEKLPVVCMAYMLRDIHQLEQVCQRTYFPTEQVSLGERTTMAGMLFYIISEYISFKDPIIEEFDCQAYADICKTNFHAGLETYEILVKPTYFNAMALMMGIAKAQDEGQISLAWTLSSAAAKHVQALGYHREATYRNLDPADIERKRYLFWTIYSMDKTLCLVLGRASSLQDYDIDTQMLEPSRDPQHQAWDVSTIIFTKLARVQGQVYEQLYSSSASEKTNHERDLIVENLSTSLQQLSSEMANIDTTGCLSPDIFELVVRPVQVIFLSLQTLLYRAASRPEQGPEVSSKCFDAARDSLEAHLQHFPHFKDAGDYMIGTYINWVLLYCSFTPIIVVFLHAIASHSHSDIKLLADVTASIEPIRTISKDCERLFQTCSVFCRVATAIVESRRHLIGGTYNEQDDSLIFFPPSSTSMDGFTNNGGGSSQNQFHNNTTTNNINYGFQPGQIPEIFSTQDFSHHHHENNTNTNNNGSTNTNSDDNSTNTAMTLSSTDMDEMSMFFGNWLGGNQPVMDLLSMDFTHDHNQGDYHHN